MRRLIHRWFCVVLGTGMSVAATSASAQVIGTFRWQFAPFCNAVSLTVSQVGASFRAEGVDEMCGASKRGFASGTAHLNPDGTVGMGITIVRPDGRPVQHVASFTVASLSGTWSDQYGNAGTLVFNPPALPAGPLRPITIRGNYAVDFYFPFSCATAPCIATGASAFSFGLVLASPPIPHLLAVNQAPTAECPGTAANPQAAPGHLCVYTGQQANTGNVCVASSAYACDAADKTGAAVVVLQKAINTSGGRVYHVGAWAVTVP